VGVLDQQGLGAEQAGILLALEVGDLGVGLGLLLGQAEVGKGLSHGVFGALDRGGGHGGC
jgi:hypothetical protein